MRSYHCRRKHPKLSLNLRRLALLVPYDCFRRWHRFPKRAERMTPFDYGILVLAHAVLLTFALETMLSNEVTAFDRLGRYFQALEKKSFSECTGTPTNFPEVNTDRRLTYNTPSLIMMLSIFSSLLAGGVYATLWVPLMLKYDYESARLYHVRGIHGQARVTRKTDDGSGCFGSSHFVLSFTYFCSFTRCHDDQPPHVARHQYVKQSLWRQYKVNDPIDIVVVPEYRREGRIRDIIEDKWDRWVHPMKHPCCTLCRIVKSAAPICLVAVSMVFIVFVLTDPSTDATLRRNGLIFSVAMFLTLLIALFLCSASKATKMIRYIRYIHSLDPANRSEDPEMNVSIDDTVGTP